MLEEILKDRYHFCTVDDWTFCPLGDKTQLHRILKHTDIEFNEAA